MEVYLLFSNNVQVPLLWNISAIMFLTFLLCFLCVRGDVLQGVSEHPGGFLTEGTQVLYRSKSPYWLRNDVIVERNAQLVIEAGTEVRFDPMIGITVRGILTAEVSFVYIFFVNLLIVWKFMVNINFPGNVIVLFRGEKLKLVKEVIV